MPESHHLAAVPDFSDRALRCCWRSMRRALNARIASSTAVMSPQVLGEATPGRRDSSAPFGSITTIREPYRSGPEDSACKSREMMP